MKTPPELAYEVLEQAVRNCQEAPLDLFTFQIRRLVDLIDTNHELQRCAMDLVRRAKVAEKRSEAALDRERRLLGAVRDALLRLRPEIENEPESGIDSMSETIAAFDRISQGNLAGAPLTSADQVSNMSDGMVWAMASVIRRHFGGVEKLDPQIALTFKEADELADWIRRERAYMVDVEPGALVQMLRAAASSVNPEPDPDAPPESVSEALKIALFGVDLGSAIADLRLGHDIGLRDTNAKRFQQWYEEVKKRLSSLLASFKLCLWTRVSSEWAVKRYAASRSVYGRDAALARLDKPGRRRSRNEAILRDDAAAYLFDLGFPVLTEVAFPPGRLDLYEGIMGADVSRDALLLEAKVYKDEAEARKAIRDGLRQLYTYAAKIAQTRGTTENYLLVFRLDGPPIALPYNEVRIGDRLIRIVIVDLTGPERFGHRAPQPFIISEEDLRASIGDIGSDSAAE